MNLETLSHTVSQIAIEAGEKILAIYNQADFNVDSKSDNSPLTAADLASHHHIVDSLKQLTPDYPILSEESAQIPFTEREQWSTYWLVDPLDGTREFIKRNDQFAILIALIHEHEPVLGVVYAPALQELWLASLGNGAYKLEGDDLVPIYTRPLANPPVIIGSSSHRDEFMPAFLANVGAHEYQTAGSIIKACRVAEGGADLYPRLGLTSEWDTAAAQIIVNEAGGHVVTTANEPLLYNTKESLLNPHFFVMGSDFHDWSQYLPK
ncbi:MAG: 3'(2'),5'-bisphosphate nucleotidase CysQ [Thiofilum sp.]|uniref:3'(2'),5'-bisphosphate nucleotidase CysQ n=1 Tax=Thiofilum sp. TaxID=2212733 RepID=UPI0025D4B845|nr:3'(2'),5'-bisphosphate nucleotidase CysQ [Thiofilum sp.]MBK8452298.1 3'(2'),5'-bisphosphate nucleotidase CysQ [Thiofilum sp.]